jgi:hypothetical protein
MFLSPSCSSPPLGQGYRIWQKTSVIPTGAERSEAQWRDLFCCLDDKKRSLGYAAPWAASLGMTE